MFAQAVRQTSAAAAKPEGSLSSNELPLIILRRPVPLAHKQSAFTADGNDSSRGPVQGAHSEEHASSCPSQHPQRQHMRRRSHRILDDSDEETGAAGAQGPHSKAPSCLRQPHQPRRQRLAACVVEDSDEDEAEAARGPAAQAESASDSQQLQRQRGRRLLSSQVVEDSEDEADAVACPQERRGRAAEAHEAHTQRAAAPGGQLQRPARVSALHQEGQVEGRSRADGARSAEPEEGASSGSSQQPLRARLRQRQATKRSAQRAVTGAKRKAKSPVVDSPKKLREVPDTAGCQPDRVVLSSSARQGSPGQAYQASLDMPALHARVEHAAGTADSAASQHTPAQGSPARTSQSLVTPLPEQDPSLRAARQAPQLGTDSNQSPTHDFRQSLAELQVYRVFSRLRALLWQAPAMLSTRWGPRDNLITAILTWPHDCKHLTGAWAGVPNIERLQMIARLKDGKRTGAVVRAAGVAAPVM